MRELGLVTREEFEDLELRVAQLEHRLKLLEKPARVTRTPRAPRGTLGAVAPRSRSSANLGRLSEIAQVAVRHGFGYFFARNR